MRETLSHSTGLKERDQKLVVYWTLATHSLPHIDTFPMLGLVGQMGTGKSQTLKIIKKFAYRPRELSLRAMTLAAIRDELAACDGGTAIIEEADQAWRDHDLAFERMLSDRYQRGSAKAAHKVPAGEKEWAVRTQSYFGATVLHRRVPFNDGALDGRTVAVRFRADHSRTYQDYSEEDPSIVEGSELVQGQVFKPAAVERFPDVAARIFNTYSPLLATSQLCGDGSFRNQIRDSLLLATAELKEAQSAETDGIVVQAIVEGVSCTENFGYVRVSQLSKSIFESHRASLLPRQVGAIARQLGFTVKNSHGQAVVAPTAVSLLRACEECGYEDEFVADLRAKVLSGFTE